MLKLLTLICFLSLHSLISANHLRCDFNTNSWLWMYDYAYKCSAESYFKISSRKSTLISSVEGTHHDTKSNNDVNAFYANHRIINFFPRGLENLFPNLKSVYIWHSGLKEVHQSDLQPLTELVVLDLWDNDITAIPKGLFDYNLKLRHISFTANKITFIDPNVFDNLNQLTNLLLDQNPCIEFKVTNNLELIMLEIPHLRDECNEEEEEIE